MKKKAIVIPRMLKIKVTRKNIDTGNFGDVESCAIAQAVKARIGDHPSVDGQLLTATLPCGTFVTYELPQKAQRFIEKFDDIDDLNKYDRNGDFDSTATTKAKKAARKKLKPFTFEAQLSNAEINL